MTAGHISEKTHDADQRPSVIYVMGAGRSGSTILGVALGNCDDAFYAGELEAWLRRSGIPNFPGSARAQFWDLVRRDVHGEELFGETAWRYLEYSLAVLRVFSWDRRRRLRPRYRAVTERLYRAIASRASAAHIIDTSHYPLRALEAQRLHNIDLYLLYLVRDPQGVVASFQRQDVTNVPKSLLATNAYLSLTHILSLFAFHRQRADRRMLVRYEDFISDPDRVMRQILDWAGSTSAVPNLASLHTGLPFQGNRLLESDVIALRRDPTQQHQDPPRSDLTRLLQLPWSLAVARLTPRSCASHD